MLVGQLVDCFGRSLWATLRENLRLPQGIPMKTTQVFIFFGWLLAGGVVSISDVRAADLQYDVRARSAARSVALQGRNYCPDRFSCSSLYGAYGPYGGGAYWTRYTYGGWGYIR